ncbi:MAG: serine/threonine protein kinase [Sporolactobacillus sp.]
MTVQDDFNFYPGTWIIGKWHKRRYQLIKKIGSGAQGTVYLALAGGQKAAIKLAKDRASLISEVNVLKQFEKLQGDPLGPSLYDNDDWITGGRTIGFCVMEYLRGIPASEALQRKSFDWTIVFLVQLLKQLQKLHDSGYIFADLKPENLMIIDPGHRIRCVDFGGATRIGRSVREYTEFYDRGYWGFGSRKAEPGYDLFACAMIMIFAASGQRFNKSANPHDQLVNKARTLPLLEPYKRVVLAALTGKYQTADQMQREVIRLMMGKESQPAKPAVVARVRRQKRKGTNSWFGAWLTASILLTLYVLGVLVYSL